MDKPLTNPPSGPPGGRDLLDRQREHFNSIAERYRSSRTNRNHLHLKKLMWNSLLGDMADFKDRRLRVLEPMCGFAHGLDIVTEHLSNQIEYLGYDYSDEVVATVRRDRPQVNILHADATRYQPPNQDFDVVILIGGLHHVPDYSREVVQRSSAALRPGGIFINFEPTHGNRVTKRIRERIYDRNTLFDSATERSFAVDELLDKFESAGLRPLRIRYPGLLSYIFYYNPDAFPALNIGGPGLVTTVYGIDQLFWANRIGRFLSFATASVWKRPV